ncbi:tRNA(Ile)-lysidine synthase [Mucilaginibacter yixingensis]|uniref:tRNA(Ile)-lysidine synthase n=1 Tax=Mucilaginibacter yixingensis TaxID=1295612 RepID=A0A2T5J4X9_9SPHI|nr:tRNA lysidine(34) synthetase TilS [Mucilaginibacter yixingensis]PTQ92674.1 tRNA(Ile)-lysidine synthase [Mucilaginibacter yixingensis]
MLPVQRFNSFINQHQLFTKQDVVLATVSGGMDSVLMVRMLAAAGYRFAMAHCNFGLRGAEADADEQFCRQLANDLDASFHNIRFDTAVYAATNKISIQMAARQLRYEWFETLRSQHHYAAIALAHHQNDTIETILLNLTRGTGIAGLHGILPKNGHLVRPLLFLQREEIEQIIRQENICYREDSSNASTKYARNKIRHEVIPKLKELNPSLEQTFDRNLQHFKELEQLLELELDRQRAHFIYEGDDIYIPLHALRQMQPARLLLGQLLKPFGFNDSETDDLLSAIDKHPGRQFISSTHQMVLDREQVIISSLKTGVLTPVSIGPNQNQVIYGDYRLSILRDDTPLIIKDNPSAASVDAALIVYPLTIRAWQQGDTFYPLGMKGKQKLSDFFIQQKVPVHKKQDIPLIINGNGDVIWIGGYRLNDRYKVSPKTEKVIIFELYKQT